MKLKPPVIRAEKKKRGKGTEWKKMVSDLKGDGAKNSANDQKV